MPGSPTQPSTVLLEERAELAGDLEQALDAIAETVGSVALERSAA